MRIQTTEQRERRLKRAMDAMDENTKAGAIDRALKHYLADKHNKEAVADELPIEIVQQLSTPHLPIQRETTVEERKSADPVGVALSKPLLSGIFRKRSPTYLRCRLIFSAKFTGC